MSGHYSIEFNPNGEGVMAVFNDEDGSTWEVGPVRTNHSDAREDICRDQRFRESCGNHHFRSRIEPSPANGVA